MEIVAHRGLHTSAPENSLGAVQAALDAGLRYIEVDVRAAVDGTLFLLHDARVDRTTEGSGRLSQLRASEVRLLHLSDGTRLPRLEEAIELCRGRAVLCADIKEAPIADRIVSAICSTGIDAEVWSSYQEVVAHAADSGLKTALIALGIMPRGGVSELIELGRQLGARALPFFPADLEPSVMQACSEQAMPFMCGTPNDPFTWRRLADAGARAIITDDPLRCAALLGFNNRPKSIAGEMS